MAEIDPLFSALQIGKLKVAGRVYKTATAETRADDDGFVTDELLDFYAPMADAGTPLIITGNIYISQAGKSTHRMTGADDFDASRIRPMLGAPSSSRSSIIADVKSSSMRWGSTPPSPRRTFASSCSAPSLDP